MESLRGRTCPALQRDQFSDQAAEVVSQPQRQCGKHTVGGAENPGTTATLVVLPYQPSTPQGLGHQSSMETYSHNFFYISKGVDNDFISDYRSSLSVDNDHMEVENYVDNLGLFEESDDDIKADYISPDGKSNNNTEIPNVKGRLASHLPL